ncbi:MAG: PilN domain-containing protein [Candidatus Omnitrophota bacterium]
MTSGLTAVQITDYEVRALGGQWPNLFFLQKERSPDQDLRQDLKETFSKFQGSKLCILILPRHEAILKELELPSTDPGEISRMIGLQIPVMVPFDQSQVVYRYFCTKSGKPGYSVVLAAAVLNQAIQKYADALIPGSLGVTDIFLSFETLSVFIDRFLIGLVENGDSVFLFANRKSSELIIYQGQKAVFSYYVPFGQNDIADNMSEFGHEIGRCLSDFERTHPGVIPGKLFYDLEGVEAAELRKFLQSEHEVEVQKIDFFSAVPDQVRGLVCKERMDSSWAALLGFFAADERRFTSFLPQGMHSSKIRHQNRKILAGFFSSLVAMIAAGSILTGSIFHRHESYLRSLKEQIQSLEPRLENIRQETEFLSMLAEKTTGLSMVEIISEIYILLPEDVFLQYLGMREQGQFELQGTALADQSLSAIQTALASSDFFKKVDLQYATKRRRFDKEYTEFKVTFEKAR